MGKKDAPKQFAVVADYRMSFHYGICAGIADSLLSIDVGEKRVWSGTVAEEEVFSIDLPQLWGGVEKEGGIGGQVRFLPGEPTQTMIPELAARLGRTPDTCPAFRGVTTIWFYSAEGGQFKGFLWGSNSPYIRDVSVRVWRRPKGSLDFTKSRVVTTNAGVSNQDANPASIIWECLTNKDWGMGSSTAQLDIDSFLAAQDVLYDEGFGLSLMWTRQTTIEQFVNEILDHIQATLFVNPSTGLIQLNLIRGGYDVNTLPEFDPDNCVVTDFSSKSWGETTNEIIVTWTNPSNEEEETHVVHDLGNIQVQGGVVSDSRNYYGIRSRSLANKVAVRDLRLASAPLRACNIVADRSAWRTLLPGSVIKLTWPEYGFEHMIFRVGSVDFGKTGDSHIKASLTEDIFGLGVADYIDDPPETAWEDPSQAPTPMDYSQVWSAPHYLVRNMGVSEADLTFPETMALVFGATENPDAINYTLLGERTTTTGALVYQTLAETKRLSPRCELALPIAKEAQTDVLVFQNVNHSLPPEVSALLFIGSGSDAEMEVALVESYSNTTGFRLARGVLDTVPKAWPAGTPVWIVTVTSDAYDTTQYGAATSPKWKQLLRTSLGRLLEADAPILTRQLTARVHLPNRPANVKIDGSLWGPVNPASGATQVVVTWSNRNRNMEDAQIRKWTEATVTPEVGQTTVITVMGMDRSVITTHADLTGTSFNLPISSFGDVSRGIVRVASRRDGLDSLQAHEIEVTVPDSFGWGFDWGNNWNGAP